MIGTATRNTEPHQKRSSNHPPTTGPIAVPPETQAMIVPMATARCCRSRNIVAVSESVDGMSVAPAIPISALVRINISAFGAYAASTEIAPYAAAPISWSLRRPMRSPHAPTVINEPASRNA